MAVLWFDTLMVFVVCSNKVPLEHPTSRTLQHRELVIKEIDIELKLLEEVVELAHQLRICLTCTGSAADGRDAFPH